MSQAGEWFETIRLALGAFLTSPGAGILGLIGAGYLAYRGVDKRLAGDMEMARKARKAEHKKELAADARERWQWAYQFLWDNRDQLPVTAMFRAAQGLAEIQTTANQAMLLDVLTGYIERRIENGQRRWSRK